MTYAVWTMAAAVVYLALNVRQNRVASENLIGVVEDMVSIVAEIEEWMILGRPSENGEPQ